MRLIKKLVENIKEELHDAEKYAKLAAEYKDMPELSKAFVELGKQELTHADMLHTHAVKLIDAERKKGVEPPKYMLEMWNEEHIEYIERAAQGGYFLQKINMQS